MTLREKIAAWLNTDGDYFLGVVYYSKLVSHNPKLFDVLKKGPNSYRRRRLQSELESWFSSSGKPGKESKKEIIPNRELYNICKKKADIAYKELMNQRAVLFAMSRFESWEDPNLPQKVDARRGMAISIVEGWKKVSELYEQAAYVEKFGRLPDTEEQPGDVKEIPDRLVKQTLDNLRKSHNKLKHKEQTPERVALMQEKEKKIKILEKRWHSLRAVS